MEGNIRQHALHSRAPLEKGIDVLVPRCGTLASIQSLVRNGVRTLLYGN